MNQRLAVVLSGPFRLVGPDGRERVLKSAKAQGVIALLATAPGMRRSRVWLQDKLWSDRGRAQGAGSLRQALCDIRHALGNCAPALVSDRMTVSLDASQVHVIGPPEAPGEFLEGIDVRDPEFEDWLREQRCAAEAAGGMWPEADIPAGISAGRASGATVRRPVVAFHCAGPPGSPSRLFEDLFVDVVSRSLSEALSVTVVAAVQSTGPGPRLDVMLQAYDCTAGEIGMRVRLVECDGNLIHWSGKKSVRVRGGPPVEEADILALGNQLIDALADALWRRASDRPGQRDANILGRLAIRKIFSMDDEALVEADGLLHQASDQDPCAVWLAWRAQLRVIRLVERHGAEEGLLRAEASGFVSRALELEPSNSVVLAGAANARLVLEDDLVACHELALRSVELNPANPLAWDALSNAKLYRGEAEASHLLAVKAQRLGSAAPHRFWWDMGRCLSAALTGRADEALKMAEQASALAPSFRPPLRYLTGLYARAERFEDARRTAEKLARIEPDFSTERLANDPTYPASVLRRAGLLDAARLREVGV